MAPTEVPAESILPLRSLKVIDRAMQLPVVHDTFGGVAKYTESIRNNSRVQSATQAVQAGFKTLADLKPVMAVKDAVFKSATMSDVVLPRMAGAVESLDSLACDRLDTLKAAMPAISEPTPQLLQTTRKAASGYWAALENYFASFTVAQVSLGLADKSLDVAASVVAKVGGSSSSGTPTRATAAEKKVAESKAKTMTIVDRIYQNLGGLREYVRELKKRGEPAATDLPVLVGKLATRLVDILHLNAVLGYLGLSLEEEEATKKSAEEKTGGELPTAKVVPIQQQSTAKRSMESESSDED